MQGGLVARKVSVSLSFCLSVKRVIVTKRKKIVQIFILYEKAFSLVFLRKEWWVMTTPSTWNFAQQAPVRAKSPMLNRYSVVTP